MAIPLRAGGDIYPSRVVVQNTVAHTVIQASNSTVQPIGISSEHTRAAPGTPFSSGLAGADGDAMQVFQIGDRALVEVGSNSITADQPLKSDANGRVVAASSGDYIVGFALEAATASQTLIRCYIAPGKY